jgi:hypothetical protein
VAVRPEFGPTLPALLAARGVSRRTMALGLVVLIAAGVGAVTLVRQLSHSRTLDVGGPLPFSITYDRTIFHPAAPHPGELARLEGSRRGKHLTADITARTVSLPPYSDNLLGGYLPVLAETRIGQLRAAYPTLEILDEGKARTNDAPGYQIGFRAVLSAHPLRRMFGRDIYALPGTPGTRLGILISVRQFVRGKATQPDQDWIGSVRATFRSFAFDSVGP